MKNLSQALSNLSGLAPRRERIAPSALSSDPVDRILRLSVGTGRTVTEEQAAVLEDRSPILKVNAYAGCAKTSTLEMLAKKARNLDILYIALNKSVAQEAQRKFGDSADCRTTHGLAYRWFKSKIDAAGGDLTAKLIEPTPESIRLLLSGDGRKVTQAVAGLALRVVKTFVASDAPAIASEHLADRDLPVLSMLNGQVDRDALVALAARAWELMLDRSRPTPLGHDGYMKAWSLSAPDLSADLILLDEAQDSNPALLSVLAKQSARRVYVGDRHQAIYSFRGAVNALDRIVGTELTLTRSFRFGPQIAEAASGLLLLCGAARPLVGAGPDTRLSHGQAPYGYDFLHVARTNAGLFRRAFQLATAGKKMAFIGREGGLPLEFLHELYRFKNGVATSEPLLQAAGSFDALMEQSQELGMTDVATQCRIVASMGEKLPAALASIGKLTVSESEPADAVLSTVHKAKGLEFDYVEIADDFSDSVLKPNHLDWVDPTQMEEANMIYVALTRAKKGAFVLGEDLHLGVRQAKDLLSRPERANASVELKFAAQNFSMASTGPGASPSTPPPPPEPADENLFAD